MNGLMQSARDINAVCFICSPIIGALLQKALLSLIDGDIEADA